MFQGVTTPLARERVALAKARDKWEALELGLALCRDAPAMADFDAFAQAVRQRERVLPTGLERGLAVPHVRTRAVREPVGSLLLLADGVDYGSPDGEPVRLLLTVGMPADSQHEWLLYMGEVASRYRERALRERLLACADADELWTLLRKNDGDRA